MKPVQLLAVLLPLVAGCFSAGPRPQAPVNWTIETRAVPVVAAVEPKWGVTRLAQVAVRAPYDGAHLAVLRAAASCAVGAANRSDSERCGVWRGAVQGAAVSSGRL